MTLPACIVFSALLWWIDGLDPLNIASWMVCLFTTYVLTELDNVFQLIRFRTRLVPCFWLFVSACLNYLHPLFEVQLPACCMALSCFFLLRCYQHLIPVGSVFHSFLFLSLGSLLFAPMLLLAVPLYVCLHVYMSVKKWRTLWAAVIGLLLPYAGWSLWCMWFDDFQPLAAHFQEYLLLPSAEQYLAIPASHLVSAVLLVVLCWVGIVYYVATSFSEKIRVRMLFNVLDVNVKVSKEEHLKYSKRSIWWIAVFLVLLIGRIVLLLVDNGTLYEGISPLLRMTMSALISFPQSIGCYYAICSRYGKKQLENTDKNLKLMFFASEFLFIMLIQP